jgi:putative NIF3 family GTP cyclohydrolase 1 type 2
MPAKTTRRKIDATMPIPIAISLNCTIQLLAPRELEEEWDNSGMQINMGNNEVSRVLVALEITKSLIAEAMMKGVDFIITHHPLLFNKIDQVDNNDIIGNYIIDLVKADISVYSAHTTFDEAFGGNNEYLADLHCICLSRLASQF